MIAQEPIVLTLIGKTHALDDEGGVYAGTHVTIHLTHAWADALLDTMRRCARLATWPLLAKNAHAARLHDIRIWNPIRLQPWTCDEEADWDAATRPAFEGLDLLGQAWSAETDAWFLLPGEVPILEDAASRDEFAYASELEFLHVSPEDAAWRFNVKHTSVVIQTPDLTLRTLEDALRRLDPSSP